MKKLFLAAVVVAATGASSAFAHLIQGSPTILDLKGTGIGAVNTVLTVQNNDSENGCVSYGAGGVQTTGSTFNGTKCTGSAADVKKGASQTPSSFPLSTIGITTTGGISQFGLVYNINQTNSTLLLDLNSLAAIFFNPITGAVLLNATYVGPQLQSSGIQGTGGSGFFFVLDSTEQAELLTNIHTAGLDSNVGSILLGGQLSAGTTAHPSTDGPENIFAFNTGTNTPVGVPDPASIFTLGSALIAAGGYARRRMKKAQI